MCSSDLFYNPGSARFNLHRFSKLPYDASTYTKLHHIGKAVETLIINHTESAKVVLDLCTKVHVVIIALFGI